MILFQLQMFCNVEWMVTSDEIWKEAVVAYFKLLYRNSCKKMKN